MASILIKNGRVWNGQSFQEADVLTDKDLVARIEPDIRENADFTYDAAGRIVSAGLVDLHVHMAGISNKTFGIHAEMSCLPFGVTAAVDAGGGQGDQALLDSFLVKNMVFTGVRISDNRPCFEKTEQMLEKYGDKVAGVKVYFDDENPGVRDITPLQQICRCAREKNWKVMVHCTNSPSPMAQILDTLSPGDILTHVYHGGKHTAAEDDFACIQKAKQRGIVIDAGFAGHVHTDFAVLKAAFQKGVFPDTISTDITKRSAYMRGGRYGLTMCMSMCRTLGMPEEAILKAVTSSPAKAVGKTDWGILRIGGVADLAVLEHTEETYDLTDQAGNRLQDSWGYRCLLTVADGQVIYKH